MELKANVNQAMNQTSDPQDSIKEKRIHHIHPSEIIETPIEIADQHPIEVADQHPSETEDHPSEIEDIPPNPNNARLRFRNYMPRDPYLSKYHSIPPVVDIVQETINRFESKAYLDLQEEEDHTLLDSAPKKQNWDLQRDLEPKLAQLSIQTEQSLTFLLKKKFAKKT